MTAARDVELAGAPAPPSPPAIGVERIRVDELFVVEIGYRLFPGARGRGVATRVVRALAARAFAGGVYPVHAAVCIGNGSSERVLERAGITRESVLRRLLVHDGGRKGATHFSLLADDAGA